MFRKALMGAAIATLVGVGGLAQAQITVTFGPPAPQHEVVPAPRAGYVWAPGHYEWRNGEYVWMRGHWVEERPGFAYVAPRWVQRADGSWHLAGGNWERRAARMQGPRGPRGDLDGDGIANRFDDDRDGDGILNANDHRPNVYDAPVARRNGPRGDLDGDGVQNRYDRDRDGDGVANARDRYPNDRRYV